MNARLSPPDARPADPEASGKPMVVGTRKAQPGGEGGMRAMVTRSGVAFADQEAVRIAVRQLNDKELAHEMKLMGHELANRQWALAEMRREKKRRTKGKSHA